MANTPNPYTTLPQTVADTVNNFHANFNPTIDDAFIWNHNKTGVYSTKSGYSWLLSSTDPAIIINPSHSWSWIWKLQVPEKYKFFIWLAIHEAVPTLSLLHHRNIAPSATCERCGEVDESFMHCVRDCKFSKTIWQKFGFSDSNFYLTSSPQEWLKDNSKGPRSSIFFACLWWSWLHRNHMCFNSDFWSLTRLSINIQHSAETIHKSFQPIANSEITERWIRWNSSNHSCHILNADGSCLGTPVRAGYGGLIRNSAGLFLSGYSGFFQDSTCILFYELTAIHKGLSVAVDMGIDELICFSDSQLSINLITGDASQFHAYAVLIQDIKDILAAHNFSILHTLREGNHCADFMAKLGASSNVGFMDHLSPPHDLLDMLRNDAMRTCFLRA
jgi:ribonuclease HI